MQEFLITLHLLVASTSVLINPLPQCLLFPVGTVSSTLIVSIIVLPLIFLFLPHFLNTTVTASVVNIINDHDNNNHLHYRCNVNGNNDPYIDDACLCNITDVDAEPNTNHTTNDDNTSWNSYHDDGPYADDIYLFNTPTDNNMTNINNNIHNDTPSDVTARSRRPTLLLKV